ISATRGIASFPPPLQLISVVRALGSEKERRCEMEPYIRIFPHGPDEFPSMDHLQGFLLVGLRGRGGKYLFPTKRVDELPTGSVVLFRYSNWIVGEAIVSQAPVWEKERARNRSGEEVEYVGRVVFAPSSVRLYSPPLSVECLQELIRQSGENKDIQTP